MAHIGRFFRDIILPVGGAIVGGLIGGPAGAAAAVSGASAGASAGAAVGGAVRGASDSRKAERVQNSSRDQLQKHQDQLAKQLANERSKVNSAFVRSLGRSRRGLFGGEVQTGGQSAQATLG